MPVLKFTARKIDDAATARCQCAVVPIFSDKSPSGAALQLDHSSGGQIKRLLELGDFSGKSGETQTLPGSGSAKRLVLVGCGSKAKFDRTAAREFVRTCCHALAGTKAKDAIIHTADLGLREADNNWLMGYLARQLTASSYRYNATVSDSKPPLALNRVAINTGKKPPGKLQKLLLQGSQIGNGVNLARNLANLPGNICTPTYLAGEARKLGRKYDKLSTQVLEEKKMRDLGMGALLAVSAGTDQPAKLVIMHYRGGKSSQAPYVLVGKGVTFDTGGISLKPGAKMDEMKYDMGGAASVIGTMQTVADMQLPLNVIGVVAAVENMPSGGAIKPGDVVSSMSGKTVEILNTDAEGRLILCDALTYVERFKPAAVIDVATLTGACVVALGNHATAVYSNQEELAQQILDAGIESHDRGWQMPLWDEYKKQLQSNFADLPNIAGPGGGSITAACFLASFTEKYHWAHLDIAGTAWDSSPKGATGRPVPMLVRYLQDRAE